MEQIKKLTVADYEDIFKLSQFAFQYKLSDQEIIKKKNELKDHTVLAWMENNKLAGKIHIIPLSTYINEKVFKLGGVASVATWPEYRRQGIIKHLLYQSLKEMKRKGQLISFLAPFSFAFYRKYGWELTFTNKHYTIPIDHLRKKWSAEGLVQRIDKDIPRLQRIYTKYAKQYTGMLTREEKWWKNRVLEDDMSIAIAINSKGQEEGYIIFKVQNRVFTVKEVIYTTLNGRKLLLEFMANHDSMAQQVKLVVPENDSLPLLLNEPRFDQKLIPYFMARIVDVNLFLQLYPFSENEHVSSISIQISDDFFPENSGIYQLNFDHGTVHIIHKKQKETFDGIQCTIQQFTSLLLGFKRPVELYDLGLIAGNYEQVKKLEQLIPIQQTFFPDFF